MPCYVVNLLSLQLDIDYIQCDIRNLGCRGRKSFTLSQLFGSWNKICRRWARIGATDQFHLNLMMLIFFYLGQIVDTVVMNPPFGTRKKGADMDFLSASLKVNEVVSLWSPIFHKSYIFLLVGDEDFYMFNVCTLVVLDCFWSSLFIA